MGKLKNPDLYAQKVSNKKQREKEREKALENQLLAQEKQTKALSKSTKITAEVIEHVLSNGSLHNFSQVLCDELSALKMACGIMPNQAKEEKRKIEKYKKLLVFLLEKAPKLVNRQYWKALWSLCQVNWVRNIHYWQPKGKGAETQMYSLIDYLAVEYEMPKFLYDLFFMGRHLDFFEYLAGGGSMYKAANDWLLPLKMTRKMCHIFLNLREVDFYHAIRYAQVVGMGGREQLAVAFMNTEMGESFYPQREAFWAEIMQWFCVQDSFDLMQLSPLLDYIYHCKRENLFYSLKGRTIVTLMRGMNEWHEELAKIKKVSGIVFRPSGLVGAEWEIAKQKIGEIVLYAYWKMEEILCSKRLLQEGKTLHHCVYSYAQLIESQKTSIWSLQCDETKLVTVQVIAKKIVQARGLYNRLPNDKEKAFIQKWALQNGLEWVRS